MGKAIGGCLAGRAVLPWYPTPERSYDLRPGHPPGTILTMRTTTDLGDWGTLPLRLRVALVAVLVLGLGLAATSVITGASFLLVLVIGMNLALVIQWAFVRRRGWWPDEPGWPDDPIDRNGPRNLVIVLVLDGLAVAALVLRVALPL